MPDRSNTEITQVNGVNSLTEAVLAELVGGVWHTTRPDRFERILDCGVILNLVTPPIAARQTAACGSRSRRTR